MAILIPAGPEKDLLASNTYPKKVIENLRFVWENFVPFHCACVSFGDASQPTLAADSNNSPPVVPKGRLSHGTIS